MAYDLFYRKYVFYLGNSFNLRSEHFFGTGNVRNRPGFPNCLLTRSDVSVSAKQLAMQTATKHSANFI